MHPTQLRKACCFVVLALLPWTAAAQDWDQPWSDPRDRPGRVDLSVSAGMLAPTDWSDLVLLGSISPVSGVLEQVLVRDVRIEPNSILGGAVTYWRDRYGVRVHAALSRSSLVVGGRFDEDAPAGPLHAANVDTWFYDVRGAIGLVKYSPARKVLPYAFLGFGGITYNLDRALPPPLLTFIERGGAQREPGAIIIVEDQGRQFLLSVNELSRETVFAVSFGAGADLRIPLGGTGVGLRLEVADHVAPSPVRLRIQELGPAGGLAADSAVRFGVVHHLRMTAALVVQIGR